jgi:hypothetical protein
VFCVELDQARVADPEGERGILAHLSRNINPNTPIFTPLAHRFSSYHRAYARPSQIIPRSVLARYARKAVFDYYVDTPTFYVQTTVQGERCRATKPVPFLVIILLAVSATMLWQPVSAVANARIQNDTSYVDSLGYLHVVGEVLNTADAWLSFVKITGTLKDSNGQIVDVTFTYAYADYLPPAQRAPFNLIETDASKSAKVTSYTLALSFQQATTVPSNTLTVQGDASSIDSLGYLNIVGQVKNAGTQTSNFTKVVATFYNQAGKVVYVDFTYTSPSDIPAGQTYSFKIIGPGSPISSQVAKHNLFAESQQYTSIPEWRSPLLIVGIVLSLAVIALKSNPKHSIKQVRMGKRA